MQLFLTNQKKSSKTEKVSNLKSKSKPNYLTVKELADRYEVAQRVAHGWCQRGLFPNAKKVPGQFFEYWQIPETDLENFTKPTRRGRPSKPATQKPIPDPEY